MSFNSLYYFIFAAAVLSVFFVVPQKVKWTVLLAASYIFYSLFSIKAALLLLCVSLVSYLFGRLIGAAGERQKKVWLVVSCVANVSVLFFFKYVDFLIASINHFRSEHFDLLRIILPIGISFYIFQALSYLIDIYLERIEPERHVGYFLLYLSFFPKLLQGPIERADVLLPQLKKDYVFNYDRGVEGLKLILFGLVKKLVIADRLAVMVNMVFAETETFTGISLILAIYAFTLQIYFDFAGYTDIARGLGKLFGIELSENFQSPYLSPNIQEFWRRWHITFSLWLKDYLFMPLMAQFRNYQSLGIVAAAMITFVICGLWHGASWGFVVFGVIHGVYISGSILTLRKRNKWVKRSGLPPALVNGWRVFMTFNMVAFSFIFFRVGSIQEALYVITHLWGNFNISIIQEVYSVLEILLLSLALLLVIKGQKQAANGSRAWQGYFYYGALANLIIFFGMKNYAPFIYFQF